MNFEGAITMKIDVIVFNLVLLASTFAFAVEGAKSMVSGTFNCESIFEGSTWPPANWAAYLATLAKQKSLTERTPSLAYKYSYVEKFSGDTWGVFTSTKGDDFNINLNIFPETSREFLNEYDRISKIVNQRTKDPNLDNFSQEAYFLQGGWQHSQVRLDLQNQMWPGNYGQHLSFYPIGKSLGGTNDLLMIQNQLFFLQRRTPCRSKY